MRILQICQRPQRRGAEVFARQLRDELTRQGQEVATVYLYPYSGDGELPTGAGDYLLDGDENHPLETLIGFRPALLRKLTGVMQSFRPDITQVNGARTVKYGVLSRRLNGAPSGAVVYRNIGAPDDWIRGLRRKLFYRMILRDVDGVAAISRDTMDALRSDFSGSTPLTVISNAVDPGSLRPEVERADVRALTDTPESVPVVLFVGSLASEKRVDRLIDAVRDVRRQGRDLHLWIVGDGPLRRELEARAVRIGIDEAVRFLGSRRDVGSFMAAADMLALVSDTEGVPGVLLEAGYLGLPVVATRVGGVPEVVSSGNTGLLVRKEDTSGLVTALIALTDHPELREELGVRARERIAERHSIGRIANQFLDFYEAVLRRPDQGGRDSERGLSSGEGSPSSVGRHRSPDRGSESDPSGPDSVHFSLEMGLLTILARSDLDPRSEARVRSILDAELDWDLLLGLARRHKLLPLVTAHLRRFREALPPTVDQALVHAEFVNGCKILERTGQLMEILSGLDDRGITAVPYKGPALGAQLYGSGALRPVGDLDIVVRPQDVPDARRVMVELGYRPQFALDDELRVGFMLRHRYDERFVREDGSRVELHWGFTNRDFLFTLDLDDVFSRLDEVEVGGHVVPAFCPEDLLLILSVHGAKHRWDRLEWLAGVAELLRKSETTLDWPTVLRRSSILGVRRSLFLALRLASDLLDVRLPKGVLARVDADGKVADLAGQVVDLLRRDPAGWEVSDRLQRDRFRIGLRERWRDRMRFVWHRATTPSDPDRWQVVRVGPWDLPLHALRRPFHVAGEIVVAARALIPSFS